MRKGNELTHIIAMSSGQFPQQRIYPVMELPARPEAFKVYYEYEDEMPIELRPNEMPRSATYIGTAEWAWSPMNNRLDGYFISTNRQRSYWILWAMMLNDEGFIPKWEGQILTYGPKRGADKKTAALYLIKDLWCYEKNEYSLDHFHILDNVGLLTVAEFMAIGRAVWPEV